MSPSERLRKYLLCIITEQSDLEVVLYKNITSKELITLEGGRGVRVGLKHDIRDMFCMLHALMMNGVNST